MSPTSTIGCSCWPTAYRKVGAYVAAICVFDMVVRALGVVPPFHTAAALIGLAALVYWVAEGSTSLALEARTVGALIHASFILSFLVPTLPPAWRTPQMVAGYGVLQGALSGGATALWVATKVEAGEARAKVASRSRVEAVADREVVAEDAVRAVGELEAACNSA